jgi:microcystin-dependent protein
MGSPVIKDSIPVITGSMQSCDSFKALLQSVKQLGSLVEWLFDDDGLPNVEIAREFGAIIHPPGSTMDYVLSPGTSLDSARQQVETLWLNEDEQDAYTTSRDSVQPFWVIADDEQRGGAPNMAGRFKLNADFRLLNAGNVSGLVGLEAPGGAKDHTLVISELPAHVHELTVPAALGPRPDINGVGQVYVPKDDGGEGDGGSLGDVDDYPQVDMANSTGNDQPHNNMPPYYVVLTIYRTSRMS